MNEAIEIFKPGIATLRELAEKYKGINIDGVADERGYVIAKDAKKELAQWRIDITKAGTGFRAEARAYASEVIRQEKEHLDIITPVEDALKGKIEAVDAERAKIERVALLPARKALLAEIGAEMTDDEILNLDEKQFSAFYMEKKVQYLEEREAKRKAEEDEKRRADELAKVKEEAATKAVEEEKLRAERERLAEEKKKADEEAQKIAEADAKAVEEAEELAKLEKNRKYKAWLKTNGVTDENMSEFYIAKQSQIGTFVLYKKVSEITIA